MSLVLVLILASLSSAPCEEALEELVRIAVAECPGQRKKGDEKTIRLLLEMEKKAKTGLLGLVVAAACRESRFTHRPMPPGDGGLAVGLLQLHPWWELRYGIDRTNAVESTKAYLHRIGKLTKKAKRLCENRDPYLVAQAWVASGPDRYRCRYSRHYSLWRRWARKMMPQNRSCIGYGKRRRH